jgi:hypothetical protein
MSTVTKPPRLAALPRRALGPNRHRAEFRPTPKAVNAVLRFQVPDRLFRCQGLSMYARGMGITLCMLARNGEQWLDVTNPELVELGQMGRRTVDESLAELEVAGLVYRITRRVGDYEAELKHLKAIGLRWDRAEMPARLIVLLWNFPQPGEYVDAVTTGQGVLFPT